MENMIRAGSTMTPSANYIEENLKCIKLKIDSDRESTLYSSYSYVKIFNDLRYNSIYNAVGEWLQHLQMCRYWIKRSI
jgi:hypothetical protein